MKARLRGSERDGHRAAAHALEPRRRTAFARTRGDRDRAGGVSTGNQGSSAGSSSRTHRHRRKARRRRNRHLHRAHRGRERDAPVVSHRRADGRAIRQYRRSGRARAGGGQARAAERAQRAAFRTGGRDRGPGAIHRGAEQLRAPEIPSRQRRRVARPIRARGADPRHRPGPARFGAGAVEDRPGSGERHRAEGGCRRHRDRRPPPSPAKWSRPDN